MTRSYVWHDSFICVTWLVHMCDMTRSYVWHDSFICVTWLIHVTHSRNPLITRVPWLCWISHVAGDIPHSEWLFWWLFSWDHDSSLIQNDSSDDSFLGTMTLLMTLFLGPWLFWMTHSEESWHIWTSHVALTRRIHTCDMTHSHTWQNSLIWVTWLIRTRHTSYLSAWRDSFICST